MQEFESLSNHYFCLPKILKLHISTLLQMSDNVQHLFFLPLNIYIVITATVYIKTQKIKYFNILVSGLKVILL